MNDLEILQAELLQLTTAKTNLEARNALLVLRVTRQIAEKQAQIDALNV
jgi:hypothetical protein